MKTKLIPLLLAALLVLAGCGSDETPATTDEPVAVEDSTGTEDAPLTDGTEEAPAEMPVLNELDYSTGLNADGFHENVTAKDFVELFDHSAVGIPSDIHMIPDSEVQTQVDGLLTYFVTSEPVMDKAVEDGDTVNIDYVGSIDGVPFDGGNTQGGGTDVTIGVTSYIDDFLEQLIGHMPGDTLDVEVTFPEDYQATELAGKDAVFVTTINHISVEIQPELNDAFVSENLSEMYEWTSVDGMYAGIAEELQKNAILQYLQTDVLANTVVSEVPASVMDYQKSVMLNYYKGAANEQGLALEDFVKEYLELESVDALFADYEAELTEAAEFTLIVQAIAEDAGISISDEMVGEYFLEFNGSDDYSEYETIYGMSYLKFTILQDKVMEYLTDNAELM